jgi:hypothetical protein
VWENLRQWNLSLEESQKELNGGGDEGGILLFPKSSHLGSESGILLSVPDSMTIPGGVEWFSWGETERPPVEW